MICLYHIGGNHGHAYTLITCSTENMFYPWIKGWTIALIRNLRQESCHQILVNEIILCWLVYISTSIQHALILQYRSLTSITKLVKSRIVFMDVIERSKYLHFQSLKCREVALSNCSPWMKTACNRKATFAWGRGRWPCITNRTLPLDPAPSLRLVIRIKEQWVAL